MGWYLLLLVLALTVSLLAVRHLLLVGLEERIEQELVQEAEELRALAGGLDPADGEPFGQRIERIFEVFLARNIPHANETMLTFVGGEPHLRSANTPPLRLDNRPELVSLWAGLEQSDRGQVETEEVGTIDYLAVPLRVDGETAGVFVAAIFSDLERAAAQEVVRIAATVALVALLLACLLAWSVASRVLAPVREITRAARGISESDLTGRIDVSGEDELGQLAATFNAMLDRLERAFLMQRSFVNDAGHELRTPITIIRGHLELIEDDPTERAQTIALVLDELDRMNRMVEDLLLLAKAQRPGFLQLEPVDLGALTLALHAKAEGLSSHRWELEAVPEGSAIADRQRLTQAVMQLAANAVTHAADSPVLRLGCAIDGATVRFWVRDEGPGVPRGEQARIFERFSRARSGTRTSEGSGLGLSIVKAIAEAHGGQVVVDSTAGMGSTFTVTIPLEANPASGPEPS